MTKPQNSSCTLKMAGFQNETKQIIQHLKDQLGKFVESADSPEMLKANINDYLDCMLQAGAIYPKDAEDMIISDFQNEFARVCPENVDFHFPLTGCDPHDRHKINLHGQSLGSRHIEGLHKYTTAKSTILHGIRIPANSEVIELPTIKPYIKDFFFIHDNVRHFMSIDQRPPRPNSPNDRLTIHSMCCTIKDESRRQRRVRFKLPAEVEEPLHQQISHKNLNQLWEELLDAVEIEETEANRPGLSVIPDILNQTSSEAKCCRSIPSHPVCPRPSSQNLVCPPAQQTADVQPNLQQDRESLEELNEAFREISEAQQDVPCVDPTTVTGSNAAAAVRKVILEHPIWKVMYRANSARKQILELIEKARKIAETPEDDLSFEFPFDQSVEEYENWLRRKYAEPQWDPKFGPSKETVQVEGKDLYTELYNEDVERDIQDVKKKLEKIQIEQEKESNEKLQTDLEQIKNLTLDEVGKLTANCDDKHVADEEDKFLNEINERRRRLGIDNLDQYLPEQKECPANQTPGEETFLRELLEIPSVRLSGMQQEPNNKDQGKQFKKYCSFTTINSNQKSKKDRQCKKHNN